MAAGTRLEGNSVLLAWSLCREMATETFARHCAYVFFAAKVRAQGRAALGRYPLICDCLGQCLVSDGFEIRIGSADKTIPVQTERFAIHTLGHKHAFAAGSKKVCSRVFFRQIRLRADALESH